MVCHRQSSPTSPSSDTFLVNSYSCRPTLRNMLHTPCHLALLNLNNLPLMYMATMMSQPVRWEKIELLCILMKINPLRIIGTLDGHTLQVQAESSIDHILSFAVNWYALCQFTGQEVFHLQSAVLIVPQWMVWMLQGPPSWRACAWSQNRANNNVT